MMRLSKTRGRRAQSVRRAVDAPEASRTTRGRRARLACAAAVLACAVALGVSVAVAAAPSGDAAPAQSVEGSTVGILVDAAPAQEEIDSGEFQGNDSNVGILVAAASGEDVAVTFLSQGAVYGRVYVGYGSLASEPDPPKWDWSLPDTLGLVEADGIIPAFDAWCVVDDAGGQVAYDFAEPVTRPLTLHAGWNFGDSVRVTLHGLGGVMEDADPSGSGEPMEVVEVSRYEGAYYRFLPTPVREGYTFEGWWTKDGRASGDWGAEVAASDRVGKGAVDLYAKWEANRYTVRYVNNTDLSGGGRTFETEAVYDGAGQTLLTWSEAVAAGGFFEPSGKRFRGWNERPDGSGESYDGGSALPNLTDEAGAYVALFAQWEDDGTGGAGPFEVRFVYNDGATADLVVSVERGMRVDEPEIPKRAGWQFAGWFEDKGLENAWSFDTPVMHGWTLYAKWDLRLDVTVPVSVGFAVNADTGEVETPDAGRYAIRSRTAAPVAVEEVSLASTERDMGALFEPPLAGEGVWYWDEALRGTELWLRAGDGGSGGRPADADPAGVVVPFAGERSEPGGEGVWESARRLEGERLAAFTVPAFDRAALAAAGGGWPGEAPCSRLGLKLGMEVPADKLRVRAGADGPQRITVMTLAVSAKEG